MRASLPPVGVPLLDRLGDGILGDGTRGEWARGGRSDAVDSLSDPSSSSTENGSIYRDRSPLEDLSLIGYGWRALDIAALVSNGIERVELTLPFVLDGTCAQLCSKSPWSRKSSSSESISSLMTFVRTPTISSIRAVVPPNMMTVKTTTISTVALRVGLLFGSSRPAASATPTAPLRPAQKSIT